MKKMSLIERIRWIRFIFATKNNNMFTESRIQSGCCSNKWGHRWCWSSTRLFGGQVWPFQIDSIARASWRARLHKSVKSLGGPWKIAKSKCLGAGSGAHIARQRQTMLLDTATAKLNRSMCHRRQWCRVQTNGEILGKVNITVDFKSSTFLWLLEKQLLSFFPPFCLSINLHFRFTHVASTRRV